MVNHNRSHEEEWWRQVANLPISRLKFESAGACLNLSTLTGNALILRTFGGTRSRAVNRPRPYQARFALDVFDDRSGDVDMRRILDPFEAGRRIHLHDHRTF